MGSTEFAAFPTDFPSAAAARIGQAVLNRTFDKSLIEDAYDVLGYALGKVFGSSVKPTFGDGLASEDDVAKMLVAHAETGPGFAADEKGLEAVPWTLVVSLVLGVIQKLLKK